MGVDWAIAPSEPGNMFVVPLSPPGTTRLTPPIDVTVDPDPLKYGILKPEAVWHIPLAVGERVYGTPAVVNNTIIVNTAFGSFSGDISTSASDPGNLKIITGDKDGAHVDTRTNDSKSFGGVLIVGDKVVVTTDERIHVLGNAPAAATGARRRGMGTSVYQRITPVTLHSWELSLRYPELP